MLTFVIIFSVLTTTTFASSSGVTVILDGNRLLFDVQPQIINSRTMVPLRVVFEAMGAEIAWDGGTQTATATKGDTVVVLKIGDTSPTINGRVVTIDQPGIIVDGRTLAPLRFVAEAFGGNVAWDSGTQTASITLEGAVIQQNHIPTPSTIPSSGETPPASAIKPYTESITVSGVSFTIIKTETLFDAPELIQTGRQIFIVHLISNAKETDDWFSYLYDFYDKTSVVDKSGERHISLYKTSLYTNRTIKIQYNVPVEKDMTGALLNVGDEWRTLP
jgi:hypothetical protein